MAPSLASMQPALCACSIHDPVPPLALCKDIAGQRRLTAAAAAAYYTLLAVLAPSAPAAPLLALLVPLSGGPRPPARLMDRLACSLAELRQSRCASRDTEAHFLAINTLRRAVAARQAESTSLAGREGQTLVRALLTLPLIVYRAADAGGPPPVPEWRHAAAAACGVAAKLLGSGVCGGLEEFCADLEDAVSALCGWGGLGLASDNGDTDAIRQGIRWAGLVIIDETNMHFANWTR